MRLFFRDWPLRVKVLIVLFVTATVPLAITLAFVYQEGVVQRREVLEANGDKVAVRIADQIDALLQSYQKMVHLWAGSETIIKHFAKPVGERNRDEVLRYRGSLVQRVKEESDILAAMAMLNADGRVAVGSSPDLEGRDLSGLPHVREALETGQKAVGQVQVLPLFGNPAPEAVIPVIEPIKDNQGHVLGFVTLSLKAKVVEDIVKQGTALGGKGSVVSVLDRYGIRIAHSEPEKVLYRPTGPLPETARQRMIEEQRFGPDTAKDLAEVLAFPEQYERAVAEKPAARMFE